MRSKMTKLAVIAATLALPALAFAATHAQQIGCICGSWCPWKH
jgi:hypothetical protein